MSYNKIVSIYCIINFKIAVFRSSAITDKPFIYARFLKSNARSFTYYAVDVQNYIGRRRRITNSGISSNV